VDPKDVVQPGTETWNARDFESFVEGYTDDCEVMGPGFTFKGQQGIRDFWAAFNGPYPDNRVIVHRLLAEGSTVVEEGTFQGTHTGSMTAPDGREIPPITARSPSTWPKCTPCAASRSRAPGSTSTSSTYSPSPD
jgi:hypothetical protein